MSALADRPTLATIGKLIEKIGYEPTPASEMTRATDCLVEASELIRDEAGITWLNAGGTAVENVPPRVERICIAAAFRGFDNSKALSQRSLGDSSQSWDRVGVEGGAGVYLTPSERRAVVKAAAGSVLSTITLVTPYSGDVTDDGLVESLNSV